MPSLTCPSCGTSVAGKARNTRFPCPGCGTTLMVASYESLANSFALDGFGGEEGESDDEDGGGLPSTYSSMYNMLMQMTQGAGAGGMAQIGEARETTATHRTKGLSNIQCKLLGPIFTHFIARVKTGDTIQPQRTVSMPEGAQPHVSLDMLGPWAFAIEPEYLAEKGYGVDKGAEEYLKTLLDEIARVNGGERVAACLFADGDGHCLVHSVSRAIAGQEFYWHLLRTDMQHRLRVDREEYLRFLPQFAEEMDTIIEEASPTYTPPSGEMHGLRTMHVFALANALKRPIILFDGDATAGGMDEVRGCFLPLLHHPDECKTKKPIAVAWSSRARAHFVAVTPVKLPGKDTLGALRLRQDNGQYAKLDRPFLGEDCEYSATVGEGTGKVHLEFSPAGARPVYLPKASLPTEDGQVLVWGAPSREEAQVLIDRYIDFFPHPELPDTPCCILGGTFVKDFSEICSILDKKFAELHEFPTEFAREVLLGMETTVTTSMFSKSMEETIEWAKLLRHSVFYCTICTSTVTLRRRVFGECPSCKKQLSYPIGMADVPCVNERCGRTFQRVANEVNPGESMYGLDGGDTCTNCGSKEIRPYSIEKGGFVLKNGDRTRIATQDFRGCCGYKHIHSEDGEPILEKSPAYDFRAMQFPVKWKDGTTRYVLLDVGFDPKKTAQAFVQKHSADLTMAEMIQLQGDLERSLANMDDYQNRATCIQEYRRAKHHHAEAVKLCRKYASMTEDERELENAVNLVSRGKPSLDVDTLTSIAGKIDSLYDEVNVVNKRASGSASDATLAKDISRRLIETMQPLVDFFGSTAACSYSTPAHPTVTVNGKTCQAGAAPCVPLSHGMNEIVVEVAAADGSSTRRYVLHVTREGTPAPPVAASPAPTAPPAKVTTPTPPTPTKPVPAASPKPTPAVASASRAPADRSSPERSTVDTHARVRFALPSRENHTVTLPRTATTDSLYTWVRENCKLTGFTIFINDKRGLKAIEDSSTVTLEDAGVASARLEVKLDNAPTSNTSQQTTDGAVATASSTASPTTPVVKVLTPPCKKKLMDGSSVHEDIPSDRLFSSTTQLYKIAQVLGLVDKQVYVFDFLPGIAFFYNKQRDALIMESKTRRDLQPGGLFYAYIKSMDNFAAKVYSFPKLKRYFRYDASKDELVEVTDVFSRLSSLDSGEDGASAVTATPVSFAGQGHRLGSTAPPSSASGGSGARGGLWRDTADDEEERQFQLLLAMSLGDAHGMLWRSESEDGGGSGLSRTASSDPTTAAHFLESGALMRSLSNQGGWDEEEEGEAEKKNKGDKK